VLSVNATDSNMWSDHSKHERSGTVLLLCMCKYLVCLLIILCIRHASCVNVTWLNAHELGCFVWCVVGILFNRICIALHIAVTFI
jgi:uncharacterized protein with PQ loop repeat